MTFVPLGPAIMKKKERRHRLILKPTPSGSTPPLDERYDLVRSELLRREPSYDKVYTLVVKKPY